MFTLRLTHKISSIAALGIAGLLLLGGLYLLGDAKQDVFRKADDSARSLEALQNKVLVTILRMRRAEKDFLLRKDEKNVQEHLQMSKEVSADLDDMRRQASALGQNDLVQNLNAMQAGTADYDAHFAALTAARVKLGLKEDKGLEGSLRASVHAIEGALKAFDRPSLAVTMLMMRRHEKDFMLRGEAKSGDDMKKRAAEFSAQLARSDIPAEAQADLGRKLEAYQRDFFAWVATAQLAAKEQSAISARFAAIEPMIAAVEQSVKQSSEAAQSAELTARGQTKSLMQISIAGIVVIVGLMGFLIGRSVSRPLSAMTKAMHELADGNFAIVLPGLGRKDEIGEIAQAVETFKVKAERKAQEESEAKARQDRLMAELRKKDMYKLADDFEAAVGEIVHTVSSASTELEASATTLTTTADRSRELATLVAAASEEASTNVQSVASATEEMSSSVNEISRQVQNSSRIASEAVDQARSTNDRVGELSQAASRIGDVVELINTIAGQTNLLALNATIEAARAGEAGRGFAVVASEVKALAEQTAKATGEISQQINGIQSATQGSVAAIREIGVTIGQMSEISSTIASAVEEQGAATQEISRNVQQAAQGTMQVSSNISDVQLGASETGAASAQVLSAAQSLSRDSSRLKDEVSKFLRTVRAA
ncbi:methyl-accepting chemotaxis protein [Rhodopseudomonas rhenobacensis]|uniref:Methyl-accepting chemotaxis protein n=1 Tax=Rhodopseudomonas rhenobacensis TaxID=87461 RepID=A0A7W8DZ03_9BRAD|nr:methyl-accepting chemotaxis protein [Rhodopseudomonas rhenobacensis]MBB5047375.1 methyl-accepting chemotaxis protein [Rhodopseudomonas rhenobacensis]